MARVGVVSTMGLMGVVSLPRAFVFRLNPDDPHPAPWIRVKLSAAIGKALYPQPIWDRLSEFWESYYPLRSRPRTKLPRLLKLLRPHDSRAGRMRCSNIARLFCWATRLHEALDT